MDHLLLYLGRTLAGEAEECFKASTGQGEKNATFKMY